MVAFKKVVMAISIVAITIAIIVNGTMCAIVGTLLAAFALGMEVGSWKK